MLTVLINRTILSTYGNILDTSGEKRIPNRDFITLHSVQQIYFHK